MKNLTFPYLSKSVKWTYAIPILNRTNDDTLIQVSTHDYDGVLRSIIYREIPPGQIVIINPTFTDKCWVDIYCEDGVYPVGIEFSNVYASTGMSQYVPVKTDPIIIESNASAIVSGIDPIINFSPASPECNRMRLDLWAALQYAAYDVYMMFPDRRYPTIIGDCCPSTDNCAGHPNPSHEGGIAFDRDYFTLDGSSTQYGDHPVNLWDGDILIPGIVDWEKELHFVLSFAKYAGNSYNPSRVAINEQIVHLVRINGNVEDVLRYITLINPTGLEYNHGKHAHVRCDGQSL